MNKKEEPKIPEPFKPNKHLSDQINQRLADSEIEGGIFLNDLEVGHSLEIETKNRIYILEKRGKEEYYISGHPEYCPEPTRVTISGSTWGGSMLKVGFIGRGMRLEYVIVEKSLPVITTSEIKEIKEFIGKPK